MLPSHFSRRLILSSNLYFHSAAAETQFYPGILYATPPAAAAPPAQSSRDSAARMPVCRVDDIRSVLRASGVRRIDPMPFATSRRPCQCGTHRTGLARSPTRVASESKRGTPRCAPGRAARVAGASSYVAPRTSRASHLRSSSLGIMLGSLFCWGCLATNARTPVRGGQ